MKRDERGITLIALIITVIVLLILAGTAISIAINGGDIFSKASTARDQWNASVADEENKINIKKVRYCEICDKRLESNQDYLLHMSSKKHKYKMKELLKKELKECGSVRKLLIKEKMIAPCKRWRINNARYLLYGFALNRYLNN